MCSVQSRQFPHLNNPFYPPDATGVNDDLLIIRMQLGDLLPDFLHRDVVVGGQPLRHHGPPAQGPAPKHSPGVPQIGHVERVAGNRADKATRSHRRDLRPR